MTSAESMNYTAAVRSRQCPKDWRKNLERKHVHPQDVLSQKTVILFWKKEKS